MADRTIPISEHARSGGLALALAETPEQRRVRTAPARVASINSRAAKAGRPGMLERIAIAEAALDSIADPDERARKVEWIARAHADLARVDELRRQREAQLEAS